MSALVLTLKQAPPQRCDLSPLTPDRLAATIGRIEDIEIGTTRRSLRVGDIFDVRTGEFEDIRIEGGSERLDDVGRDMSGGSISVAGDLGQLAGRGMRGGSIRVAGSVGRLAGSGMSGGLLEIGGDAGDLVGGPLPGEMRGMTGGIVHIRGNAGDRAGDRMRRGLVAIGGRAGESVASRMIGGTLVCFGPTGPRPGYLMRRGTLILGGAAALTPTFVDSGVHELVALRLLARWLLAEGIEGGSLLAAPLRRFVGDTAVLGKGEIFTPAGAGA